MVQQQAQQRAPQAAQQQTSRQAQQAAPQQTAQQVQQAAQQVQEVDIAHRDGRLRTRKGGTVM